MRTRCLEFHAKYRCQHSGSCCRAPWDIEVEPAVVTAVREQRIVPLHGEVEPFRTDPAGSVTLARGATGDCHFHRESRCSLQLAGGKTMLPSACRHFPRVLLLDARGCLLTLSHYCPTAAALLVDGTSVQEVDAPLPLALQAPLEGLDARDVLPPLLRPGMLMDVESYGHFEAACVASFGRSDSVGAALEQVAQAVESIRRWTPERDALVTRIDEALHECEAATERTTLSTGFALAASLTGPHPWMQIPDDFAVRWDDTSRRGGARLQGIIGRYLAAATFGNWMPYRGQGLRTVVEWLRACYDVLRLQIIREAKDDPEVMRQAAIEALRAADYLMVHTVDSLAFGRGALACEHAPASR